MITNLLEKLAFLCMQYITVPKHIGVMKDIAEDLLRKGHDSKAPETQVRLATVTHWQNPDTGARIGCTESSTGGQCQLAID